MSKRCGFIYECFKDILKSGFLNECFICYELNIYLMGVMSYELKKNSSSSGSQESQLKLRANSSYFDTSTLNQKLW